MTLTYFSRSLGGLNCQIWAKRCLCAQYLMNQLADLNQICMDITFGHDKKLNRFSWPSTNFQGHCQINPPNLSQKVFVCMLSHGPLDRMLPNLQAYINQTRSIACSILLTMTQFQGQSFVTEIATIDWFGRWGISVFSENTAIHVFVYGLNYYFLYNDYNLCLECYFIN